MVEQGVDQRAVRVAGGRMDHQPLGLVHHDHVAVLVHHIQGDVLGRHVHRLRVRQGNGHGLSPAQAVVFRQGLSGRVTRPSSHSRAAAERVTSGGCPASQASSRVPVSSGFTWSVRVSMGLASLVVFLVEP